MQEHFPPYSALPLMHARLLLLSITRRHVYHFFYMVSQTINSTRRLSSLASMSPLLRRMPLLQVLQVLVLLVVLVVLLLLLLVLVLIQTQEISSSRLFMT